MSFMDSLTIGAVLAGTLRAGEIEQIPSTGVFYAPIRGAAHNHGVYGVRKSAYCRAHSVVCTENLIRID